MSSIFVNDPNGVPNTPGTFVEASAGMFEYVSLSGPVDQIFRAVMRSTVGVNASLGRSSGSAYVELYLANVLANGVGGARQGSVIARSNFTSSNAFFGSIVADISGSLLQGVNEFAFGLSVDTQNMGSGGSMFAVANATVPEVELLDASGNDITNEFVVTYNPTTPPVTATPEPTSLALLATGFAGLARFRRRRTI